MRAKMLDEPRIINTNAGLITIGTLPPEQPPPIPVDMAIVLEHNDLALAIQRLWRKRGVICELDDVFEWMSDKGADHLEKMICLRAAGRFPQK